jgi:hypothetical protein
MIKRALLVGFSILLLALPLTAWAANIPAKVYESGSNNIPIAVPGVKVEVFGGYGFKALLSSNESGSDGGCLLRNLPLGKEILVRLTKAGYISQFDVRSYSNADGEGVILWIGSEVNVKGLYNNLGETFDSKKGHAYLDISDENTGKGIEGIQLAASSGQVFDLGQGEYLIANAEGPSLKIGIQKPGYAFDIESATIPLFSGAMSQYYVKVQSGGAIFASGQALAVTSACVTGYIRRLSDSGPISGVSVAFTRHGPTWRPSVVTNSQGFYSQCGFPVGKTVRVTPTKPPWKFRPKYKSGLNVNSTGATADFQGY